MLTIPGYFIIKSIHESARTLIYQGYREKDHLPVIIKTLNSEYPSPRDLSRLKQEFKITQKLNFSGVLRSHMLQTYENHLFLILEDIGGISLKKILQDQKTPFALDNFFQIALQLAKSLTVLHQHHIIHKDINPSNLILNQDTGQVQIIDFGISSLLSRENLTLKSPDQLEGTLAYTSPEQTGRMNRAMDYRSDFYSLGITFYELLTGDVPFYSKDPMGMIHYHIAQEVPSLHKKNPQVPKVLSQIVSKLLSKTAERRYQSAHGLFWDLEQCELEWKSTKNVLSFPLGKKDRSTQFQIPQKLYGRKQEMEMLISSFERISEGQMEVVLVSGHSGVGKSALVQEIQKFIFQQRGYFSSANFTQLQQNFPYAVLVHSFQEIIRFILTESQEQINSWKKQLLNALYPYSQILIDVIPELEIILGKQPSVNELEPIASQNRFHRVFQSFIRLFTTKEHPFVLFLDDLQWADSASLRLLEQLAIDPESHYFLLIGAYRNNEMTPNQQLIQTLERMQEKDNVVTFLAINPLSLPHTLQLVAETCCCSLEKVQPLAELIHEKTHGNPFFINQLLYSLYLEGLFEFNPDENCWEWDYLKIQKKEITDNVVDFMVENIHQLSQNTEEVLCLAACIGNQFDLGLLSLLHQKSLKETISHLWPALEEGLIIPLNEEYKFFLNESSFFSSIQIQGKQEEAKFKFLHDRVQQAAYNLLSTEQKKKIPLTIGRWLLEKQKGASLEGDKLFDTVNYLNQGVEMIQEVEEKKQLIQLNFTAGKKAKEALIYKVALLYFSMGIRLLPEDSWHVDYPLTFSLHLERAECQFFCGNSEKAEESLNHMLQYTQDLLDQTKVYKQKLNLLEGQRKYDEGVAAGREILQRFNIHFPSEKTLRTEIKKEKEKADSFLAEHPIKSLLSLPPMKDLHKKSAAKLLMALVGSAGFISAEFADYIILKVLNLIFEYGNADFSPITYSNYGNFLVTLREHDHAYKFGKLALKLNDQMGQPELKCKLALEFGAILSPYCVHLRKSIQILTEGIQAGLEYGDFVFANYTANNLIFLRFLKGDPLSRLKKQVYKYQDLKRQLHDPTTIQLQEVTLQFIANLQGKTKSILNFNTSTFQEKERVEEWSKRTFGVALRWYYTLKVQSLYVFRDYEGAYDIAQKLSKISGTVISDTIYPLYGFLSIIQLYSKQSPQEKRKSWLKIKKFHQKFEHWAKFCPENFAHREFLMQAEMARVKKNNQIAMDHYEKSIQSARSNGYLQDLAIACELCARFYEELGYPLIVKTYLREARYSYLKWEATAKVAALEEEFPHFFTGVASAGSNFQGSLHTSHVTGKKTAGVLDLNTVMKASQAISSKIVLERLLKNLMKIVIQNAGAQRGFLILERNGEFKVRAKGEAEQDEIYLLESPSLLELESGEKSLFPFSLLRYVMRTEEYVILHDASHDKKFKNDPYFQREQPRSVLCSPILHQGKLIGILYLENNLTIGAFTPQRLEVLQILSSQAAISIQNSYFYENLKQVDQLKDEFLANISHEIKTPLTEIQGLATLLLMKTVHKEERREYYQSIYDDSQRLVHILNNVINLSMFESKSKSVVMAPIQFKKLSRKLKYKWQARLRDHLIFKFPNNSAESVVLESDQKVLELALQELIHNAVTFNSSQQPEVTVEVEFQDPKLLSIQVIDNGKGISEEHFPYLFNKFYQIENGLRCEAERGVGLGLTIVKEAIELLGGNVQISSKVGEGSTFSLNIPYI